MAYVVAANLVIVALFVGYGLTLAARQRTITELADAARLPEGRR